MLTPIWTLCMAVALLFLSVEMYTTYDNTVLGSIFLVSFLVGLAMTIDEFLKSMHGEEDEEE